MTNLKELLELAKEATPGPWESIDGKKGAILVTDETSKDPNDTYCPITLAYIPGEIGGYEPERQANAKFIAAANPKTITDLLTQAIKDRKQIENYGRISESCESLGGELECREALMIKEELLKEAVEKLEIYVRSFELADKGLPLIELAMDKHIIEKDRGLLKKVNALMEIE